MRRRALRGRRRGSSTRVAGRPGAVRLPPVSGHPLPRRLRAALRPGRARAARSGRAPGARAHGPRPRGAGATRSSAARAKARPAGDAVVEEIDARCAARGVEHHASTAGSARPGSRRDGFTPGCCRRGRAGSAPAKRAGGRRSTGAWSPAPPRGPAEADRSRAHAGRAAHAGCERVVPGIRVRRERFNAEFSAGHREHRRPTRRRASTPPSSSGPSSSRTSRGTAGCASASPRSRPPRGTRSQASRSGGTADLGRARRSGDAALRREARPGWRTARRRRRSPWTETSPMPEDALIPEPGTGVPREVGKGKTAQAEDHLSGRGLGVSRQYPDDGRPTLSTRTSSRRAGERSGPGGSDYDPAVDAATARSRARRSLGFKVRARRLGGEEVRRHHVHLRRAGGRGLPQPASPGPPGAGRAGAAVEPGAVARAGADGGGRRARGGRVLGRGGEAARHPLARPRTGREDEGGARRARRRLRAPGLCPREPQALRHGRRGREPVGRAEAIRPAPRPLPGDQRALSARQVVGRRGHARGVPRLHQPARRRQLRSLRHPAARLRLAHRAARATASRYRPEIERVEKFLREYRLVREPLPSGPAGGDRPDDARSAATW